MTDLKETIRLHGLWLRRDPEGKRADLRGADMEDADMRGALLWFANMQGAEMRGANVQGADMRGADMLGADMRRANLRGALLWFANMQGADMRGADLTDADLWGADLTDADLWGCVGNEREIKSRHGIGEPQVWVRTPDGVDVVQIGCERHTIDEWDAFTDAEIRDMKGDISCEWWAAHKEFVLDMVRADPAVPYGRGS